MSWRVYLGEGKKDFADWNLSDFADMKDLCAEAMWKCPLKVFSEDMELLVSFMNVMFDDHAMGFEEIWTYVWDTGKWSFANEDILKSLLHEYNEEYNEEPPL